MSNIPYSGGTIVNTTFVTTTGTRLEIVSAIESTLVTAGWSVISGGGTGTVILKSATTTAPKSYSIRVRLFDPGSGACAQVRIQDDSGTYVSQVFYLLPVAGKTFKIIACKYNFFVCTPQPSASRDVVYAGTLHIPTFLEGFTTGSLGFLGGNSSSDSDTSVQWSFRTTLSNYQSTASSAFASNIAFNSVTNCTGDTQSANTTLMPGWQCGTNVAGSQWVNGAHLTREAIIGFGTGGTGGGHMWQGIIHNAMIVSKPYLGDTLTVSSYDSHAWYGFTHNNTAGGNHGMPGTLFLAIS